jgi:prepilin peptidase CpaA
MSPLSYRLLALMPMFALLVWAVVIDLRSRRIPNWLTAALAVSGLAQSFINLGATGHGIAPSQALLGFLTGLALNAGLFLLRIRGGGDVKLFAAVGAWLGPLAILEIFIAATVVAMLLAVLQGIVTRRMAELLHNTGLLAVSIAHPRQLGLAHVTREDDSFRSVGRPLPYAVPVIVSTLLVLSFL